MAKAKAEEEKKETLPYGDPEQAAVSPDLSFQDSVGEPLGEEEQKARDEMLQAREDEVAAAEEHEDKIAKQRREDAEKAAAEAEAAADTSTSSTETPAAS